MADYCHLEVLPKEDLSWLQTSIHEKFVKWTETTSILKDPNGNLHTEFVSAMEEIPKLAKAFDEKAKRLLQMKKNESETIEQRASLMGTVLRMVAELGNALLQLQKDFWNKSQKSIEDGKNISANEEEQVDEEFICPPVDVDFQKGKHLMQIAILKQDVIPEWDTWHKRVFQQIKDALAFVHGWYGLYAKLTIIDKDVFCITVDLFVGKQYQDDAEQRVEGFVEVKNKDKFLAYLEAMMLSHWKMCFLVFNRISKM